MKPRLDFEELTDEDSFIRSVVRGMTDLDGGREFSEVEAKRRFGRD